MIIINIASYKIVYEYQQYDRCKYDNNELLCTLDKLGGNISYQGYIQGSYRKLDIKIKDFSRTFQHQINFFQDHLFFIYGDSNRASQNWECHKYGTLWNLIESFH